MRFLKLVTGVVMILLIGGCTPPKSNWDHSLQKQEFINLGQDCETRKWPCWVYYCGSDDNFDYFLISKMNHVLPGYTNKYFAIKKGEFVIENRFVFNRSPRNLVAFKIPNQ